MVGPEALQGWRRSWSMMLLARQAALRRPLGPCSSRHLLAITTSSRRANFFSARPVTSSAGTVIVGIGGIEEGDPGFQRHGERKAGPRLPPSPRGVRRATGAAEAHASHADFRDLSGRCRQMRRYSIDSLPHVFGADPRPLFAAGWNLQGRTSVQSPDTHAKEKAGRPDLFSFEKPRGLPVSRFSRLTAPGQAQSSARLGSCRAGSLQSCSDHPRAHPCRRQAPGKANAESEGCNKLFHLRSASRVGIFNASYGG